MEWINDSQANLNPVIYAGIIHYEYVRNILVDGNGELPGHLHHFTVHE